MVLNQATDYALRMTLFLAKQKEGSVVDATTIRSSEVIPVRFLFKIMRSLSKVGIVQSARGKNGGFKLGRSSEKISIYDIIEAIEGPIALNHCLVDSDKCSKGATGYCIVHKELAKLREELIRKLQDVNLKMLVDLADEAEAEIKISKPS